MCHCCRAQEAPCGALPAAPHSTLGSAREGGVTLMPHTQGVCMFWTFVGKLGHAQKLKKPLHSGALCVEEDQPKSFRRNWKRHYNACSSAVK